VLGHHLVQHAACPMVASVAAATKLTKKTMAEKNHEESVLAKLFSNNVFQVSRVSILPRV
jgi:hypothetical protein